MTVSEAIQVLVDCSSRWGENAEEDFARRVKAGDDDETCLRNAIESGSDPETVIEVRDLWRAISEQWIEKTLTLAIELKEARDDCGGDDRAFGHWLIDNDCEIVRHDREVLIKMGEHIDLSRRVMTDTRRRSVELIWREEIKPKIVYPNIREDITELAKIPEPPVSATVATPIEQPARAEVAPRKVRPMRNIYEVEVHAQCPVNPDDTDLYQFTIETESLIEVEKIVAFFKGNAGKAEVFQEALTQQCAVTLGARVTSVGWHSGIKVTCHAP